MIKILHRNHLTKNTPNSFIKNTLNGAENLKFAVRIPNKHCRKKTKLTILV